MSSGPRHDWHRALQIPRGRGFLLSIEELLLLPLLLGMVVVVNAGQDERVELLR